MKKLKKSLVLISMLVLYGMAYTTLVKATELSEVIAPKTYVTFNWSNQTLKQFWVNNTYLRLWFNGLDGGCMEDVRHRNDLTADLIDDDKMVVEGPQIGWTSSRWGVPVENVSITYTQVSPSFATLVVSNIYKGINFQWTYYIGDSETFMTHYKVTFLKDTNVTIVSHEFVPGYLCGIGSMAAYSNSTGYINIVELTGDGEMWYFANSTEGTLPLAENWIAVWNTTRGLAAGQIFVNQSMLIGPSTIVGLWDGAAWEVMAIFNRWYQGPIKLVTKGTVFEDIVVLWYGSGDYTKVRNLAGTIGDLVLLSAEYQRLYSEAVARESELRTDYEAYIATHNITWTTYKTNLQALQDDLDALQDDLDALQGDLDDLQDEYDTYKATHNVTWSDYESLKADLDAAKSAQMMYIVIGLVVGVVVGVGVGWVVGKRKK